MIAKLFGETYHEPDRLIIHHFVGMECASGGLRHYSVPRKIVRSRIQERGGHNRIHTSQSETPGSQGIPALASITQPCALRILRG